MIKLNLLLISGVTALGFSSYSNDSASQIDSASIKVWDTTSFLVTDDKAKKLTANNDKNLVVKFDIHALSEVSPSLSFTFEAPILFETNNFIPAFARSYKLNDDIDNYSAQKLLLGSLLANNNDTRHDENNAMVFKGWYLESFFKTNQELLDETDYGELNARDIADKYNFSASRDGDYIKFSLGISPDILDEGLNLNTLMASNDNENFNFDTEKNDDWLADLNLLEEESNTFSLLEDEDFEKRNYEDMTFISFLSTVEIKTERYLKAPVNVQSTDLQFDEEIGEYSYMNFTDEEEKK